MKITKTRLKHIIKEELQLLYEQYELKPSGPSPELESKIDDVLSGLAVDAQKGFKYVIRRINRYSYEDMEKGAKREGGEFGQGMELAIAAAREFEASADASISFIEWLPTYLP